jgi:hypothetical protein
MSVERLADPRDECLGLIRDLAVAYDTPGMCRCAELHTPSNPKLATNHVHGCPVDEAVRYDLACAGIV